ncbi:MAG: MotA/TolQ/ExbB proton channel family protein [Planctomycetes bacterium]|nr:MotA/TolQ/ExbB proton channel family protein [Planctomycetota bacterium]
MLKLVARNLFILVGTAAACGLALAAELEAPVEPESSTYWELLRYGWQINLVLGFLAFISIFLFIHVLLSTRRRFSAQPRLLQEFLDDVASGDIERASTRAVESRSLLGQVILPALKLHDHPDERMYQAAEGAGRRVIGDLRQRVTYLANIGVLCPMIGMLGTVMGMVTAFEAFGAELEITLKQSMFTGAIGKALITTAVGLIVGIPSMAFYFFTIGRVNRIRNELELAAETIIACLKETK